jgi:hypothetical protein
MNSLASLVDSLEDRRYFGRSIPPVELLAAGRGIATRQGLPGSYAGMFAPTELDFRRGIRVFTGEPVSSRAAVAHVLGEECCRLLLELGINDGEISESLARAESGMLERLHRSERAHAQHIGFYCCGICTASFWRHLAAGGLDRPEPRLLDGLRVLAGLRPAGGRWRRFPFYYTVLALTEMDMPEAVAELRRVLPAVERSLKAQRGADRYTKRCRAVLERALALARS